MTSRTFEGKIALVTGATSGIGRGVALAFAREGAKVIGCGEFSSRSIAASSNQLRASEKGTERAIDSCLAGLSEEEKKFRLASIPELSLKEVKEE